MRLIEFVRIEFPDITLGVAIDSKAFGYFVVDYNLWVLGI